MPDYFRFRITLAEIEPLIWREILIRSTATFRDLHTAIQVAAGWEDCHLFEFHGPQIRDVICGSPGDDDRAVRNAARVKLKEYFEAGPHAACSYIYDFGDDWVHDVRLVETVHRTESFRRELVDGARAFPKEDMGGVPGYLRLVELLRPGNAELGNRVDELRDWLEGWEPEQDSVKIAELAEKKGIGDRPLA